MVDKVIPTYLSPAASRSRLFVGLIGALLTVGFISRIAPLFNQGGRLLRQMPTEDGYLMLTIARNIALGHGMSTANGVLPTNGTQPLFNLFEALVFWIVGANNRETAVALILVSQVIISLVAAGVLFLLAQLVLKQRPYAWEIAALATGLWYASPIIIPHTMNCLETGAYIALVLTTVYTWYRCEIESTGDRFSLWAIKVGLLLGLTVWARIDAVFLIASITLWHALFGLVYRGKSFWTRVMESAVMGSVAVVLASPWLLYNKINFGSFTPISGTAQSHAAAFGSNTTELPSTLFEYTTFAFPIPATFEQKVPVLILLSALVLAYGYVIGVVTTRMTRQERVLLVVVANYGGLLIVYYGLLFGAAHFVSRYLSPLSPFLAIFTAMLIIYSATAVWRSSRYQKLIPVAGALLLIGMIGMNGWLYKGGTKHAHFQVVEWINRHVPEESWVGGIQTGTLGFFHDRTVNLDGKVNPEALEATLQGKTPEYVVEREFDSEGGKIQYLADWVGIAEWVNNPTILSDYFEVVVKDPEANLGVLRRKG